MGMEPKKVLIFVVLFGKMINPPFKGGTMANKYYAVKKGKTPGIYYSWDECKAQVDGFSGAKYKSFKSEMEARDYIGDNTEKEI